ncbi:MAG: AraC family transcriptional regulator ligand-binding domain-containing protein, partial [Myxococcales bacterium]|nr:AraC family transcriptional regulator ligand-binding domain-containing protein [Myxococcales bacterium]
MVFQNAKMASSARSSSTPPCTLSVRLALPIATHLRALGAASVLAEFGLDQVSFENPDARMEHATWVDLLARGAEVTGDRDFGLHAAERCEPTLQDLIMLLASSQATIRDAYFRGMRYVRVAHEGLAVDLSMKDGVASCVFACRPGLAHPPILSEYVLAMWIVLGEQILGPEGQRREIQFRHPRPADTAEHERIFRSPVHFGRPTDAIVFPAATLDEMLVTANPYLSGILEKEVRRIAENIPEELTLIPRARAWLTRELAAGNAAIEGLAEHLRMSPRTLRRRLGDEGTTYKQ